MFQQYPGPWTQGHAVTTRGHVRQFNTLVADSGTLNLGVQTLVQVVS
jgi:hypothetical protein